MIERLGAEAAPELQRLFERCSVFWELTEGAPPAPDTAVKELAFAAPGKTAGDTFAFGVYEGEELIAFAQLMRDYPKPSEWWLGLLIIDPSQRGRGLGAELDRELAEWVAAQGATTLWLGVLTQNEAAHRFWLRMRFAERERQKYVGSGGRQSTSILMSRSVGS